MTKIILIHSQGANSHSNWYEWLEQSLRLEGYDMDICDVEHSTPVNIDEWLEQLNEQIKIEKHDTYFVTHGFGTLAGLKYLDIHNEYRIEGFFSIAGFGPEAKDIDKDLQVENVTLDYEGLRERIDYFYGLCSTDDPYVPYKDTEALIDKLGGKSRVIKKGGHFTTDNGYDTFLALKNNMMKKMSR
ncbi:serine hydrolase family protein [Staphylococcus condimenti]|uniref:Serine hydrolase family protein n=1 Tax=Staphylococcus condimenti TaxID=70255 RepID=A0A143P7J0_9STAP|nr:MULTISPECIES: alpha/beta hydrolase [Staphylococcus]AMY04475.1 alpha/beta hydrolase [Staphylococcus condimenti]APR60712.1 alpha/beta hydrolase [Staphylococcus condimenti]MDK8646291.1 alpha/beta hydrolase [Staphylococcus condimenti]OFP01720.1 alpha/beta hydrolase [Staphylococcus sp. HMSC065E08]PNZ58954.1 serine hydrolase family protein [Staphylococcus condimenti]